MKIDENLAQQLVEYHENFVDNNENILDDITSTLNRLNEEKYSHIIHDHSKFLMMIKNLRDYNKNISRVAKYIEKGIMDVLLSFDLPLEYELFLLALSDFYRMVEDVSSAVKEIFWDFFIEYNRKLSRAKGDRREEIYHKLIKDMELLYRRMWEQTKKMDEENLKLIEELKENQIEITEEDIEELEKSLSQIKKMIYKSKIMNEYIFRHGGEEYHDEFSLGIKEAIRESLKSMM